MKIITSEKSDCRKAPQSWLTGTAWIDEVIPRIAPSKMRTNRIFFEPGARTAWHTHPLGQGLHVLSGVGLIQLKGQPPRTIRPGDSVWIEPGELHWHGASPNHTMVHIAMQEADEQGSDVVWFDQVTDEEYSASPA